MEKFNAEEPKNFKKKVIDYRQLEKTKLNHKQISIIVKNPKVMDGGIFGKNYILYEV